MTVRNSKAYWIKNQYLPYQIEERRLRKS
jgi:hypothetical protein